MTGDSYPKFRNDHADAWTPRAGYDRAKEKQDMTDETQSSIDETARAKARPSGADAAE